MDRQEPTPLAYRRLSLGLLLLLCLLVAAFGGQRDFHFFECAAPIFYGGGDVYGGVQYLSCAFPDGVPSSRASFAFPYPPQIFVLLAPIFALPLSIQQPAFQAASALAAATSFSILAKVFRLDASLKLSRSALLVASTLLPLLMALAMGQLTPFWLLTISCIIALSRSPSQRSFLLQGACLGIFVTKPQIVWLLALGWAAATPALYRRALVAGACASALGLTAAAWVMQPASFAQFASKDFSGLMYFSTPTLSSRLALVLPFSPEALAPVCGALALALIRATRLWRLPAPDLASLLVAASVLTTPYLWSYDFTLLLPLAFAALALPESSIPFTYRLVALLACNGALAMQYAYALDAGILKPDGTDLWYSCAVAGVFVASAWSACARASERLQEAA